MAPKPKPTKAERLATKSDQKQDLKLYRQVQAALAIERDHSYCVFCYFMDGRIVPRADVHHVYGRGKRAGDWREHYRHLLCTCRKHHPLPIQTPGGNPDLAYVEQVMANANETPIDPYFQQETFNENFS